MSIGLIILLKFHIATQVVSPGPRYVRVILSRRVRLWNILSVASILFSRGSESFMALWVNLNFVLVLKFIIWVFLAVVISDAWAEQFICIVCRGGVIDQHSWSLWENVISSVGDHLLRSRISQILTALVRWRVKIVLWVLQKVVLSRLLRLDPLRVSAQVRGVKSILLLLVSANGWIRLVAWSIHTEGIVLNDCCRRAMLIKVTCGGHVIQTIINANKLSILLPLRIYLIRADAFEILLPSLII